jgi:hypothetical protein
MSTAAPAQTFYLNPGLPDVHYCHPFDFEVSFEAEGGSTIRLEGDPADEYQVRHVDVSGGLIVLPDLPAYDGQFFQLDTLLVERIE